VHRGVHLVEVSHETGPHDDRVGQRLDVVGIEVAHAGSLLKARARRIQDVLRNVVQWMIGIVTV
jgi:hypothetical protein